MEALFRRLEAWGYPREALEWLRRHRLLAIVILAVASWFCFLVLFLGAYFLGSQLYGIITGITAAA